MLLLHSWLNKSIDWLWRSKTRPEQNRLADFFHRVLSLDQNDLGQAITAYHI